MNDPDKNGPEQEPAAHRAIREAKQGRLHPREMLEQLVAGKLTVPTSDMPDLTYGKVSGWRPALLGKADGSRWLVAFTTTAGASAYMDENPEYGFHVEVDTRWVLQGLPDGVGIVFNIGAPEHFEWNAQGLAKYKKDVLGW